MARNRDGSSSSKLASQVCFATSRNQLLANIDQDPEVDYIVLMDANDEMRGGDTLRAFLETNEGIGFLATQECQYGDNYIERFKNFKVIRARSGWQYSGSVHEVVESPQRTSPARIVPDAFHIYQDRRSNCESSVKRFARDRDLLLADHGKDPANARTVFYLAQSYACMDDIGNAFKYYKKRAAMGGFQEEVFQSLLKCGKYAYAMGLPCVEYYNDAIRLLDRAEPCMALAEYYLKEGCIRLAYAYTSLAVKMEYPKTALLWVDELTYSYTRWHLHGRTAFYSHDMEAGIDACKKAIAAKQQPVDINLDQYMKAVQK